MTNQYSVSHTFNNTTDKFIVLGNYHHVISYHSDRESAEKALAKIDIENSPFGIAEIIEPGQTVSGEMVGIVVEEKSPKNDPLLSAFYDVFGNPDDEK